jgi:hypothetical protein
VAHKPDYLNSVLWFTVYSQICSFILTGSVKYRNPSSNVDKYCVCKHISVPIPGRDGERCLAAEVAKQSKYETQIVQARGIIRDKNM